MSATSRPASSNPAGGSYTQSAAVVDGGRTATKSTTTTASSSITDSLNNIKLDSNNVNDAQRIKRSESYSSTTGDEYESPVEDDAVDADKRAAAVMYTDEEPSSDIDIDTIPKEQLAQVAREENDATRKTLLVRKPSVTDNPQAFQPPTPLSKAMLDDKDIPLVITANYGGWSESDATVVSVRGSHYMSDRVKVASGPHMFRTEALHLFNTGADKLYHVSARRGSYAQQRYEKLLQQRAQQQNRAVNPNEPLVQCDADLLNPLLVVNFVTPLGTGRNCNLVLYFTRRRHSLQSRQTTFGKEAGASQTQSNSTRTSPSNATSSRSHHHRTSSGHHSRSGSRSTQYDEHRMNAFDKLLKEFLDGSEDFRTARLKCIPRVADGGWLAKKVVNGTPAILGQKIKQHYYRDVQRNYLEIDVDLNSSMVAGKILSVVNGQAASLVVDMSFILQGEDSHELPESLLCGVRLIHLKLEKFPNVSELGL